MKSFTKVLIAILILTSLVPIMVGISCFFNKESVLELFGVAALTADLEKVFPVLGSFMLASVAMPILAIAWLIKRKDEGYVLAYLVGFVTFARGILIFLDFNSHQIEGTKLTLTPLVMGVLILLATFFASRQYHSQL